MTEIIGVTSLGRFQVTVGTPLASPGKCAVCGRVEGTFIDFGFDLDYYGVVYFCLDNCFREAVNALGYYSPEQWALAKEHGDLLEEQNKILTKQNKEYRDAVANLSSIVSEFASSDSNDSSNNPNVSKEQADGSDITRVTESYTDREEGSIEQTDESRRSDVQYDDSLDEFLDGI